MVIAAMALTGIFTGISQPRPAAAGTADRCDGTSTQNALTVKAKHGTVFYIDSGNSQGIDAAYLSYVVSSSATKQNLWVKVDSFTGGSVTLANPSDEAMSIGEVAPGSSQSAFFLVKALGSSVRAQSHIVHVYSGKPDLATSTELYSCTFSFVKVKETIKANANKVNTVTVSPATTTNLPLGSTFTVKVAGETGTIGAGSAPDNDMMWLSPVSKSSWPSSALRLEHTQVKLGTPANQVSTCTTEGTCQFTNQLLIDNLVAKANAIKANTKRLYYEASYTFRVIGQASSPAAIIPVAQISSGTQIKHTPVPATPLASIGVDQIQVKAAMTKSISTTAVPGTTDTEFSYTLTVKNSGTTAIAVDELVDTPDPALGYVPASVTAKSFTVASGGTATTIPAIEPSTKTTSTDLTFTGPYSVPAGGRLEVGYKMSALTCLDPDFSYVNSATAKIGELVIGSGPATLSQVTGGGDCGGTDVTETVEDVPLPVQILTLPATGIGDNGATLTALVDPNTNAGEQIYFEYGQAADLSDATIITAGTTTSAGLPYVVSSPLTGLTSGTIYYFRVSTATDAGDILSFFTTEPVGAPTITTDPATGISTAGATLNGSIDPNQTESYVAFTLSKTSSTLTSDTTRVRLLEDPTLLYDSSLNPYASFSGAFETGFSLDLANTGLTFTAGDTIYYRAEYTDSTGALIASGAIRSFTLTSYLAQTITFNTLPDASIAAGPITVAPTTTAPGLSVVVASDDPTVCSVTANGGGGYTVGFVGDGECVLTASQDGGESGGLYYSPADDVVQAFAITKTSRTIGIQTASYSTSYTDWSATAPTLTSVVSAGPSDGTVSYFLATGSSGCTVDATTGAVEFTAPGTCKVGSRISEGTSYRAATSSVASFTIGLRAQILDWSDDSVSISAGSYTAEASSNATTNLTGIGNYVYSLDTTKSSTLGCAITDDELSFTDPGVCYLSVTRAGNAYWTSASATAAITVTAKLARTITILSETDPGGAASYDPDGYSSTSSVAPKLAVSISHPGTGDTVAFALAAGSTGCTVDASTGQVAFVSAGRCKIVATVSEGPVYRAATSATIAFTILGGASSPTPSSSPSPTPPPSPSATRMPVTSTPATPTARSGLRPVPAPVRSALPTPTVTSVPPSSTRPSAPASGQPAALSFPTPVQPSIPRAAAPVAAPNASGGAKNLSNQSVRSVSALAAESMAGFAPGTATRIQVVGSRIAGQFIVSPSNLSDPIGIAGALMESTARSSTNFASITAAQAVPAPDSTLLYSGAVSDDAREVFEAAGLSGPMTVAGLRTDSATRWVQVDAQVATYKPGSVVYLAVTTQPVILAAALVSQDGTAQLTGYLPTSALASGGHNIRVVGVRDLGGITTDSHGTIVLASSTMKEIQRFDEGTQATVLVIGASSSGGTNTVTRIVPLDKEIPWWSLWFVGVAAGLVLLLQSFGKIRTFRRRVVVSAVVAASYAPAFVLGWVTASYEVMAWGAVLWLAGTAMTWFAVFRRKAQRRRGRTRGAVPQPG